MARQLRDVTSQTMKMAERAVAVSRTRVAYSRRLTLECASWRQIQSEFAAAPHPWIACCSYCGAVRTRSGEWVAIAAAVLDSVQHSASLDVTHGICPPCLSRLAVP
jgi:hypothetical protein